MFALYLKSASAPDIVTAMLSVSPYLQTVGNEGACFNSKSTSCFFVRLQTCRTESATIHLHLMNIDLNHYGIHSAAALFEYLTVFLFKSATSTQRHILSVSQHREPYAFTSTYLFIFTRACGTLQDVIPLINAMKSPNLSTAFRHKVINKKGIFLSYISLLLLASCSVSNQ